MQDVGRSGGFRVDVDGGGMLDSVSVNGLLCGGPLKGGGGIGGGLLGGGIGDGLRCGGVVWCRC